MKGLMSWLDRNMVDKGASSMALNNSQVLDKQGLCNSSNNKTLDNSKVRKWEGDKVRLNTNNNDLNRTKY